MLRGGRRGNLDERFSQIAMVGTEGIDQNTCTAYVAIKFASFDLPKGLKHSRDVYGRGLGLLVVNWSEISFILRSDWPSASQIRRHSRTR